MTKVHIIAEIGTAHGGSLEKAFELIDTAVAAGADVVKFQWVYADEILHPDTGLVQLPGGAVRLYDRFRALEVPPDFFARCLERTHGRGARFVCSPFGLRSLAELCAIRPDAIKIASPEVNHVPLLEACAAWYGKVPLVLSSGVSTLGDIERAVSLLTGGSGGVAQEGNGLPWLTLLHCITSYPAPESEYNVRCVDTLRNVLGVGTGISDHSLDPVLVPVLSVAMGGTMVEKHITLSRKTDGLDDPVALEPEQFALMVHAVRQAEALLERYRKDDEASRERHAVTLRNGMTVSAAQAEIVRQLCESHGTEQVYAALGSGHKRLAQSERTNYGRTNRSLHYLRAMSAGERITREDVGVLRTEKVLEPGIAPAFLPDVTGAVLQRDVWSGAGVQWQDLIAR